jgi:hypothetical protein
VSGLAEAQVTIAAPAELIWSVMVDLDSYGEWNPFILRVGLPNGAPARVGDPILLRVRMGNGREYDSPERITAIEPPAKDSDGIVRARLEYEYRGWPHWFGLIRGRRTQMLTQVPGESTVYETEERIYGAMGIVVSNRAIQGGFRRHARALKRRAENLASTF